MMPDNKPLSDYLYYGIVGIISLAALLFLPMVGSQMDMGWTLPATAAGWMVFVTTKLMVAALNMLLFHSFVKQARINVKNDERYKEAITILQECHEKSYNPRTLAQFNHQEYRSKMTTIAISSVFSTFSLGQALLTFDWMSFLSYLFTIIMGIIWGIIEMKKYEDYYLTEFVDSARFLLREREKEKEAETMASNQEVLAPTSPTDEISEINDDTSNPVGGVPVLVSPDSDSAIGPID